MNNLPVPVLAETDTDNTEPSLVGSRAIGEAQESTTFHGDSHASLKDSRGGQFILARGNDAET